MEGSPVLCAKQLLGKGGTEPQNAVFYIHNNVVYIGSGLIEMTADGFVLLLEW